MVKFQIITWSSSSNVVFSVGVENYLLELQTFFQFDILKTLAQVNITVPILVVTNCCVIKIDE